MGSEGIVRFRTPDGKRHFDQGTPFGPEGATLGPEGAPILKV